MAKVRSPNYPSLSLGPALEAVRPAFKSENRNKMSRAVLAKHLGYNSLNGRSLGKIGAVRAYGLLDGSGDELRISDDAVIALNAPDGSAERSAALGRLALKPSLFQELRKDFPDTLPSLENMKFSLVKKQFTPDAAEKAAKSYLATMNLVAGVPDAYNPLEDEIDEPETPEVGDLVQVEIDGALQLPKAARVRAIKELDGKKWVFIDGSKAGVEMDQIVVEQKGQGGGKPSVTPPMLDEEDKPLAKGTRKEVFALDEGDVVLTFPESLSATSFADLDAYLKVFIGKMKRRAEAKKDD